MLQSSALAAGRSCSLPAVLLLIVRQQRLRPTGLQSPAFHPMASLGGELGPRHCNTHFPVPAQEAAGRTLSPRPALLFQLRAVWFGPGSPLSGPSRLAVERGHQRRLQTKIQLTFSSPPLKIKTSRAGEGKRHKKPSSSGSVRTHGHIPASPLLSVRTETQGKKLTFAAIQYSPYSPEAHSVLQ